MAQKAMKAKDTIRIRRKRLDRWFYGKFDISFPSKEHWIEGGHLIRGVVIDLNSINQTDGLKRFTSRVGYFVDGEMEHAQNTIDDFVNTTMFDGVMNFAFLCADQLTIFRKAGDFDNRLGFQTSGGGYGDGRERAKTKISGTIISYEKFLLKDASSVKITNGKLNYLPALKTLFPPSKPTINSGEKR